MKTNSAHASSLGCVTSSLRDENTMGMSRSIPNRLCGGDENDLMCEMP